MFYIQWDLIHLDFLQSSLHIQTGHHPAEFTKKNIEVFKGQIKSLGFSYDWDREIATSDPEYYKWTQWFLTKLYDAGLAYDR